MIESIVKLKLKGLIFAIFIWCLTTALVPAYGAEPDPTFSSLLSEQKISPELLSQLRESMDVAANAASAEPMFRVIVSLDDSLGMDPGSNQMQSMQASVIDAVSAATQEFQTLYRYESVAGFSAEASLTALAELVALNEVVYIEEMIVFEKQDAQAHALTNTPAAHSTGATGEGVTIAIIEPPLPPTF